MTAEALEVSTAPETTEIPLAVSNLELVVVNPSRQATTMTILFAPHAHVGLPERTPPPRGLVYVVLEGLSQPINVRVEDADGVVSVTDKATGIFGAGDSFLAAVHDLRGALDDHLAVLAARPALAADLQYQLDTLRSYFPAS